MTAAAVIFHRMHNIKLILSELRLNRWQVIKINYARDSESDAAAVTSTSAGQFVNEKSTGNVKGGD